MVGDEATGVSFSTDVGAPGEKTGGESTLGWSTIPSSPASAIGVMRNVASEGAEKPGEGTGGMFQSSSTDGEPAARGLGGVVAMLDMAMGAISAMA